MPRPSSDTPIFREVIDPNRSEIRQKLIRYIQKKHLGGKKLVTYVSNSGNPFATIMRQDTIPIEDLLRPLNDSKRGCLMISCPGGDPNAAEKLLTMFRERFPDEFDVIVPDYAKSAATMLALGSDKIIMGYLSELGPIDPQLAIGGTVVPARSFIDGLEYIRDRIKLHSDPAQMYFPMLSQVQPQVISICQRAIDDSREFAEKWLKAGMLRADPDQPKKVATWLSEGKEYKSHGKIINFNEAHDKLKLNVERIDPNSEFWSCIWELYVRSTHFLNERRAAKLFESESASLTLSIQASIQTQAPPSGTPIGQAPKPDAPSVPPSQPNPEKSPS